MKSLLLRLSILAMLTFVISTVPAGAENKGYAFVFAYSHKMKAAYHTPVMTHPVNSKLINEKEYVADIKLIRQMEDAFERHIRTKLQLNTALFSFTARTGFKSEAIALGQLENERTGLRMQGLDMQLLSDFSLKP
ncbi:MAG: hypothetical protein C4519_12525 [Desulfobacteraceae bacterium]|nr:MAG: hypothetical protein C4519_12525 [Desulfobacteraceae bacterium]